METAIIIPLLLLIAFGLFEFGRAFYAHTMVSRAAREGARVAMHSATSDGALVAIAEAAASPIALSNVTVSRTAERVTVSVVHRFETEMPLISSIWGGGPLFIQQSYVARRFG